MGQANRSSLRHIVFSLAGYYNFPVICRHCQSPNPEGTRRCRQCGTPLEIPRSGAGDADSEKDREKIERAFARKYEIVRQIGKGGFAAVYLAKDKLLEREVAIKILLAQHTHDSDMVERFLREAKLYARLEHRNIVPIYDVRVVGSDVFLIMKYVKGQSLKAILSDQGRLSAEQALRVTADLASALDYIHRQGIVHRDIKPGNILIEEASGAAYLADFGIARAESSHTLTQSGMLVGTPFYLAPEQIKGKKNDPRSDLYAFGATLYELLTGKPPFHGVDPLEILYQHINEKVAPIHTVRPDLPAHLAAIVMKCLEKDANARFQSAAGMLAELERERSEKTATLPTLLSAPPRTKKKWRPLVAIGAAVTLAAAFFVFQAIKGDRAQPPPPQARTTAAAPAGPEQKKGETISQPDQHINEKTVAENTPSAAVEKSLEPTSQPPKRLTGNPPATARAIETAATGTVRFFSFPPVADVYLGGEKIGNTEQVFTREFKPGIYRFTFVIPDFESAVHAVTVAAGQVVQANHTFPPFGMLQVTSFPSARVLIDGSEYDFTPLTRKLTAGVHQLKLLKEGYQTDATAVTIEANKVKHMHFNLKKEENK